MAQFWWIAASVALLAVGGLVLWWQARVRMAQILHQLEGSEQSRFALELHAETVDARLEAMTQVLAAQKEALAASEAARAAIARSEADLANDGPATQSATSWPDTQPYAGDDAWAPSTVPSALMR